MEETTTVQKIIDFIALYGIQLIAAVAIFVIGKWIAGILSRTLEKVMLKANVEATLAKFVKNLAYMLMLVFVVIAAISKLGVQTASFIAVIGAAGLAIGMALQGSLANFAAGVMLILFRPFKVGDFIEAGGTIGSVKEVHIFNTILAHPDNRKQIVANSQILSGIITNFSDIEQRRVDLTFGISYDDDIRKAKQILTQLLEADPRVLKEPAPLVAVSGLGDSSVNFTVRPWVKPADYWGVYFDLTERVKLEFDKQGISIPYPQQDVYIKQGGYTAAALEAELKESRN